MSCNNIYKFFERLVLIDPLLTKDNSPLTEKAFAM